MSPKCPYCGSHDTEQSHVRYSERLSGYDLGGAAFEEAECMDCGQLFGLTDEPELELGIHVGVTLP